MVLLFLFTCLSPYIQFNSNNNSNCWWFLLLFYYIQVSKLLFTIYCWFKYPKYKFHSSGYQAEFSPRPLPVFHCFTRLERGLISSFTPDFMFLNSQIVTWPIPSKSVTKFGRPKAMMPVPIVFLLIRSYLVNWPFYMSVYV